MIKHEFLLWCDTSEPTDAIRAGIAAYQRKHGQPPSVVYTREYEGWVDGVRVEKDDSMPPCHYAVAREDAVIERARR